MVSKAFDNFPACSRSRPKLGFHALGVKMDHTFLGVGMLAGPAVFSFQRTKSAPKHCQSEAETLHMETPAWRPGPLINEMPQKWAHGATLFFVCIVAQQHERPIPPSLPWTCG